MMERRDYCSKPRLKCNGVCVGLNLQKNKASKCENYVAETYTTLFGLQATTKYVTLTHRPTKPAKE